MYGYINGYDFYNLKADVTNHNFNYLKTKQEQMPHPLKGVL